MAIFHLHASTGSRQGGQSARAKIDYLSRGGRYAEDGDEVLHLESGNMPAWGVQGRSDRAHRAAAAYWHAADRHERINGRLYKHLQLGLPHELSLDAQIRLLRDFARDRASEGIDGGVLPFTFTIHRGKGKNLHGDVVLSERINDGHTRTPVTWFRRAAASPKGRAIDPAAGGARKSGVLKQESWLLQTRQKWAEAVNEALSVAGLVDAIDHRSLQAQGTNAMPTIHVGVRAAAMMRRSVHADRAAMNAEILDANLRWRRMRAEADRKRQEEEEAATVLAQAKKEVINATLDLLLDANMPMAWKTDVLPEERLSEADQQWPHPMLEQAKQDTRNAIDQQRREHGECLYDCYGNTSPLLARDWRMRRIRQREEILFEREGGRLVDMGRAIVAENGQDAEVSAILELIRLKGWQSVRFTGNEDFMHRAMRAALKQAISVMAGSERERHILIHVRHNLQVNPSGRSDVRRRP